MEALFCRGSTADQRREFLSSSGVIFVDRPARSVDARTTFARPPALLVGLIALPPLTTFTAVERQTSGNSPRDGPARGVSTLRGPPLDL